MAKKALIINESAYFKLGEIVEGEELKDKFMVNEHAIDPENYILLEKLNSNDEAQVRKIVQDVLKRMFWRIYSRNAFLLK